MNNNINEAVIEKIRKCLALANGLNATQGEMEAAMGKAKEIAMRYDIDLAGIRLDTDTKPAPLDVTHDGTLRTKGKFMRPYHRFVLGVLKEVFGVRAVQFRRSHGTHVVIDSITLVGSTLDVAIAKEIFPWLETVFPQILRAGINAGRLTDRAADANGCYQGIYDGIIAANKRQEAQLAPQEAGKYAMVVRSKDDAIAAAMKNLFPDIKEAPKRRTDFTWGAYEHGLEVGSKLKLNQLGGARNTTLVK